MISCRNHVTTGLYRTSGGIVTRLLDLSMDFQFTSSIIMAANLYICSAQSRDCIAHSQNRVYAISRLHTCYVISRLCKFPDCAEHIYVQSPTWKYLLRYTLGFIEICTFSFAIAPQRDFSSRARDSLLSTGRWPQKQSTSWGGKTVNWSRSSKHKETKLLGKSSLPAHIRQVKEQLPQCLKIPCKYTENNTLVMSSRVGMF